MEAVAPILPRPRRSPYLVGEFRAGIISDEDVLLDFVVHLCHYMQRTQGTVKGNLMAARYYHVAEGYTDPLEGKQRVFLALGGIKHLQRRRGRNWPVTT